MSYFEYRRVSDDHKEGTFDSLEKRCTEYGKQGWKVIAISDGSQFRYATLEREVKETSDDKYNTRSVSDTNSSGDGLPLASAETAKGTRGNKSRTHSDKAST